MKAFVIVRFDTELSKYEYFNGLLLDWDNEINKHCIFWDLEEAKVLNGMVENQGAIIKPLIFLIGET